MHKHVCRYCEVLEGELHLYNCCAETCPFCGGQLVACGCCYEKLGIDVSKGTWAYSHGLTKKQSATWEKITTEKGRIPYLVVPNMCGLCGKLWPKMFHDDDWSKYVIPELQKEMLCIDCYNRMKELFPNGWRNVNVQ